MRARVHIAAVVPVFHLPVETVNTLADTVEFG